MSTRTAPAVSAAVFAITATLCLTPLAASAQTDLSDLFAPPIQAEYDAVAADWAARDVTPSQYTVERTAASAGFDLAEVSHEIGGLTHYGVIRYPRHHQPGGKFPVLMLLHGGFDGLDLNFVLTFDEDYPSGCVADSFLVVAPVYRGEMLNGYGILPTRWSDGDPSPFDFDCDDTMALLTAVLDNEPTADGSRVTALGGSRGGNVAYHLALRDPRIRRTVVRYGPAEFRLEHVQTGAQEMADTGATGDRLGELVYEHIAGPWLAGEITLAKARHTLHCWNVVPFLEGDLALQVHHGAQDDVVPVTHSLVVDAVMTIKGAAAPEYDYFEYPNGSHSPHSLTGHESVTEDYLCTTPAATGVSGLAPAPLRLDAAPNPFTGAVELSATATAGAAKLLSATPGLVIYDTRGRHVRTLPLEARSAERSAVNWDGRDASGRAAPAGVYFAAPAGGAAAAPLRLTRLR